MKRFLLLISFLPLSCFGQTSRLTKGLTDDLNYLLVKESQSGPVANVYQDALDALLAMTEIDQGFSVGQATDGSGGVYTSTARTTLATSGDGVSWKGFGQNLWNVPNLEPASWDNPATVGDLWYYTAHGWLYPQVITFGGHPAQAGLAQENGGGLQYQTEPGSISPAFDSEFDVVYVFAMQGGELFETNGLFKVNSMTNFRWKYGDGTEVALGNITSNGFARSNIVYVRFTHDGAGNIALRVNDLDAASPVATASGYTLTGNTEHWFGSNGHPMAIVHFFRAFKFGGEFSGPALADFETYFGILWPTGVPWWPSDSQMWDVTFNTSPNTWTIAEGTFTGGSGTRGTFEYQWYYWSDLDNTEFPIQNKIDEHTAIGAGLGGTNATLDRDDLGSLYDAGESFADGNMWFMRITYPYDDEGNPGPPFASEWIRDNTP